LCIFAAEKKEKAVGYIITLKANQLLHGKDNSDVYPVTAMDAVYTAEGESLAEKLQEIPIPTIDEICV